MGNNCLGGKKTAGSRDPQGKGTDKPPKASDGGSAQNGTSNGGTNAGGANLIAQSTLKIQTVYEIDKSSGAKLGEGSYGSVSKCRHKKTGEIRAVKMIPKAKVKNMARFKQEINIMKILDHPNLVKLFETFEDQKQIYLVMEICSGGELFDKIVDSGSFTEKIAAIVMEQIIRGVFYMHQHSIAHRDLKPENFLFATKDKIDKADLKIIDFGLSMQYTAGQELTTKAGTPYYVSPQVLQGKYNHLCDIWSCGVIMYVLLCGYPPFYGDSDAEVLSKVRNGRFSFSPADWSGVSSDAKDLIKEMLKVNPKERIEAEAAMKHTWILKKAPKATNMPLTAGIVDNMKQFRNANKFKKTAMNACARCLPHKQVKELRKLFVSMDANGDGILTMQEIQEALAKAKQSGNGDLDVSQVAQIFASIDVSGNQEIEYTEFLAATMDMAVMMDESTLWSAFQALDTDGSGNLSKDEVAKCLGFDDVKAVMNRNDGEIDQIIKEMDVDGDGEISFQEFRNFMIKES